MPRIQEYTARVDHFTPTDRGTQAREQGGRRIRQIYGDSANEIEGAARAEASAAADVSTAVNSAVRDATQAADKVENYLEQREISKGTAESAKLYSNLTEQWNERVKEAAKRDPNDPTVAAKFREEVLEPKLQEFNEAYSNTPRGRNWVEAHTGSMRQHFFERSTADMGTLAGAAVRKNIDELGNANSNTAFKSPDLHTVDYLIKGVPKSVDEIIDSAPNLKGAAAAAARLQLTQQMQEKIAKAGAIGAIARSSDPEKTAQTFADRFPELISGADAKALAANARQQTRAARQDQRWEEHYQKVAKQEASESRRNEILQDIYSEDPKRIARVNSRSIVNDPLLSTAAKEHMIRLVDREMKPESDARMSAATSRELFARIYLPEGDPNRITDTNEIIQARIDGKLTKSDFNDLRKEIVDARSPEGEKRGQMVNDLVKAVKPAIDKSNPLMGKIDQDGALNLYRFEWELKRKIAEYQKAGKDWRELFNPKSTEYFAAPAALAPYLKPLTESARDASRRLGVRPPRPTNLTDQFPADASVTVTPAPVPPRKPGETPEDWLKRTKAK